MQGLAAGWCWAGALNCFATVHDDRTAFTASTHQLLMGGCWGCQLARRQRHEVGHNVNGDGEDDGAVVLCCDAVESLEISQLGGEMVS